jgi:imidazolonepropionase-like amidohydrolase
MIRKLSIILYVVLNIEPLWAKATLHCGRMIDVKNGRSVKKVSIVIEENVIRDIKDGFIKDPKAIDLSDKTCLPGLIDLHVHFEQNFPEMMGFHHPDESRAFLDSMDFPAKHLMAGFTTVRDLASLRNVTAQLKHGIAQGKIIGPRIINAGQPISAPGGHGDFLDKLSIEGNPEARKNYQRYYDIQFVSNIKDVKNWFQKMFEERPRWYRSFKSVSAKEDLIPDTVKIMATGGVVSESADSYKPQLSFEVIEAVIQQVKIRQKKLNKYISVTAHAHGLEGIANVVLAGVNSVEHATELFVDIEKNNNEAAAREKIRNKIHKIMKEKRIFMIPTLLAGQTVVDLSKQGKFPAHIAKKSILVGEKSQANFKLAVENDIPIAFGSDTGISAHGENWKEFLLMVNVGKMTPMSALKAATLNASEVLGLTADIGSLEKGKRADIVAVQGRPDENIKDIQNVQFVMRDGVVYKTH